MVENVTTAAFDPYMLTNPDIDALRAFAKAKGTYLQGSQTFNSSHQLPPGLVFVEQPSRLHHYQRRTDEEGRFRFAGVPPGTYKISDRMSGPPTWRLRVEAKPGQLVLLDLGPDNSTRVRDDYPGHL
jgi:hypothetical protein